MPQEYLKKIKLPNQTANPLFNHLGIEVVCIEPDKATLCLTITKELVQGAGVAAGGVIATLLDEGMAHAVLGGNPQGQVTTTVDMNISYYRPAKRGDTITCKATVSKRGGRIIFVQATATTEAGEIAHATGSFLVVQS